MTDPKSLGGAALAFIGDAALEVMIREKLLTTGVTDTGRLSAQAQKLVRAEAQSAAVDRILPLLSEEETAVFHLGRNHKFSAKPKHSTVVEYRRATGFEALFGWLYLCGMKERTAELFERAYDFSAISPSDM